MSANDRTDTMDPRGVVTAPRRKGFLDSTLCRGERFVNVLRFSDQPTLRIVGT